jgi:hypothetical protein
VDLTTRTWRNPTIVTPATQGISLEIEGDALTEIDATINGRRVTHTLGELAQGSRTGYLGGFLMPAFVFRRAVPHSEYAGEYEFEHWGNGVRRDWYYVRVRQHNGQWAWSSPIWIESAARY